MNKLITIIFIISTQISFAGVSFKQAKQVFARLQNVSGQHVILKLDNDLNPDAYTNQNCIHITQGMLNFMNSDDELAAVLGHELTHWIYQDYRKYDSSTFMELRADQYGYKLCKKLKYKDCLAFSKHALKVLPNPRDGVHPDWKVRLNKLRGVK